jgi:Na+/melibiose symporter-like transporter
MSHSTLDATLSAKPYQVGTLQYTRGQLAQVFVWLLLGDFCLHLMDNGVIPTLVPLQFESLGASKTLYNFVAGTLVNIVYCFLVPIVSTWSDRTRTRIGRRRPFLLVTAPMLAIVLVMLGFSTNLGRLLQLAVPGLLGHYTLPTVALGLTVTLFFVFKVLDLFPQSVYYYLWPDVIPQSMLGTFGALFRVFYAGGSLLFNWYLIGLAKSHPEEIYMLSAGLYLVAFLVLVWRVKEPEYPPPARAELSDASRPFAGRSASLVASYFRDCFSHAFYWKYFLAMALFQCAYQPFIANLIFFGKAIYGDTDAGLKRYGQVMGYKDLIWIGIYAALVPIMARLHPLKAGVLGYVLMTAGALAGTLFIHDEQSFRIITIAVFAAVGLYLVGTAALPARMLPREKYGQFSSAGAIVFRLSVATVSTPAGFLFQTLGPRYVFAWLLAFLLLGTTLMLLLYRDWKRLGGDESFTPPLPAAPPPVRGFAVETK